MGVDSEVDKESRRGGRQYLILARDHGGDSIFVFHYLSLVYSVLSRGIDRAEDGARPDNTGNRPGCLRRIQNSKTTGRNGLIILYVYSNCPE